MKDREATATFAAKKSAENHGLAVGLGGKRETFLPDNPAWAAEYMAASMGGPASNFGRQAGASLSRARKSAQELLADIDGELATKSHKVIGYSSIRSACLVARNLGLTLPHLEEAYRIFWEG
jgi:hypothetical protein